MTAVSMTWHAGSVLGRARLAVFRQADRLPWPGVRTADRMGRVPTSVVRGPRDQRRPPWRGGQTRRGRRARAAGPLLTLATVMAFGLVLPAAWRWCRRTSRTQVHRVNQ